jgi:hypothetical protein
MPANNNVPDKRRRRQRLLVNLQVAARWCSVSDRFLWGIAQAGDLPFIKLGNRVLFCPRDLKTWVDGGCAHPLWTAQASLKRQERNARKQGPASKQGRAARA